MRIAVWHNLPSGGGKRALYCHVRGLVERGHTVEAWCPPSADQSYLPLNDLIEEHTVPLDWAPSNSGRITSLVARAQDPLRLVQALKDHSRQCGELISGKGFDVLFANTCQFLHAPSIGHFVDIPSVLYLQEPNRTLYEALPRLPWIAARHAAPWWNRQVFKSGLRDLLTLSALRIKAREELENAQSYDVILSNSAFSAETILRTYGIRSRVCYLGVDTSLFRVLHKPREPFIVSVGSFQAAKGVELALRSLSLLEAPGLRFVWVANFADQGFVTKMRALAAELNVRLEIKIRVSDEELVDLLNRATLMLYTPQLEPFGLAPLEANACGLPVVAIAEGGVRETIVDGVNGLLVAPEPQTIADAIAELLDKPELMKRLGQSCVEHVHRQWGLHESIERLESQLICAAFGESEEAEPVSAATGPRGMNSTQNPVFSQARRSHATMFVRRRSRA
ncbi:MAG TPA: glycosyltransferase family 4 protein [Pyrinomonadaceae bacterium]|nr:glycosyltransferase family 4 protein [Pyrinomonadaceae bacterium]